MGGLATIPKHGAKTVAYGLWLSNPPADAGLNTPTQRDRTLSWLRFGYQGPVVESHSMQCILDQALETDADACFIQTPGNIISEDWMLPHWGQVDFHASLVQWLENNSDFLVCADFQKIDDYFGLNTECFLVNLHQYKALGRPEFGAASRQTHALVKPRAAGKDSNNSLTSSSQLETTGELQIVVPKSDGWGFIDTSLRHGIAIPGLPECLSSKRIFLADNSSDSGPAIADPSSCEALENNHDPHRQRFLTGVETQISRGRSGVFLWNIESYDDIPAGDPVNARNADAISSLYCVAAGFKPNMLLCRHGYEPNTKVTFFDYSQRALAIRKVLLSEWDGVDYPGFCRQLMRRFPPGETFYQLWNGLEPSRIDWKDVERLWENELTHWGGAQGFRKEWQAQCALNYEFIHCDIVNDPASLLDKIHNTPGTTIWWSNAFFTITSNWQLSIERRRQRFHRWIDGIAERSPECRLYGADHNNTPVNGMNAAEYSAGLKTRIAGGHPDELKPNRHAARALRF